MRFLAAVLLMSSLAGMSVVAEMIRCMAFNIIYIMRSVG